jgi:hypothetical protein
MGAQQFETHRYEVLRFARRRETIHRRLIGKEAPP